MHVGNLRHGGALAGLLTLLACGAAGENQTTAAAFTTAATTEPSGGVASEGDGSTGPASTGTTTFSPPSTSDVTLDPGADSSSGNDTGASPMDCAYPSNTFGSPLQELDVVGDPDSAFRLSFNVPDLPEPDLISSAQLHFRSYDADHPGEEGFIYVNGGEPLALPANAVWDNVQTSSMLDVTGALIAGTNMIEFGPGPLDRSFFRVGDVELRVTATLETCTPVDDTDDSAGGMGVQQELHYSDATYTGRNNWVWRCQAGFDYAYTAAADEHIPTDCEGLYAPDGSAHGTATFTFEDVVEDDYLVEVHAYHTWNRNPDGARVIVDGATGFVQQRTSKEGESAFATAQWGVAHLEGTIDIVLDSAQGGYASDAVSWIRITPQ